MSTMKRGGRPRTAIATIAIALIVAGGGWVLWPRSSGTDAAPLDPRHHHVAALVGGAPTIDDATAGDEPSIVPPASGSAGDLPQTSLAAAAGSDPLDTTAHTDATVESSPSDGPTTSKRNGAGGLGAPRPDVKPTDVIDADAAPGGCDPAYGDDGQCLPGIPPSQAGHAAEMVAAGLDPSAMIGPWTCAEVREYFADGIAVRVPGVDPDDLDRDGDGVACDPD